MMKTLFLSLMRKICFLLAMLYSSAHIFGQMNYIEDGAPQLDVVYTEESITLDGVLNESIWATCKPAENFSQYWPSDTIRALGQTQVYFAYDDDNLYFAAVCQSSGNNFITESLKRDYGFRNTDNLSIMFDTFEDNTNSLLFGVNAYGAMRDATISNGGRQRNDFDNSWDNKWYGNSKIYDDKWVAEVKIPFKALRFSDGSEAFRVQIYRYDSQCNEMSTWIHLPRNLILMNMSYMGNINYENPIEKNGKNIAFIPYVIGSSASDFEDALPDPNNKFNVGGDVKIGITTGLNLDLTINPDFSQVEVDQQVTNLDRFEIFFPERRQFFLENADLFSSFGRRTLNPFFSRRIGVAIDTSTGVNIQNQVHYGARLSGKINDDLRIGVMNLQTASDPINDVPVFNYSVIAAQQNVFAKSNIAFIALNKQSINSEDVGSTLDPYNRLAGLEYRYFSDDDKWYGKFSMMKAFSASEKENDWANFTRLGYTVRRLTLEWEHAYIGDGFDAELGFVPRRDVFNINPRVTFNFFPKSGNISRYNISLNTNQFYKLGKEKDSIVSEFGLVDANYQVRFDMDLNSGARFNVRGNFSDIFLLDDFDPTRIQEDDVFLAAGTDYQFTNFRISYNSDRRKVLSYSLNSTVGQFYNGNRYGLETNINYRYTPYGTVTLSVNYNKISLADSFVEADLWLIGPKFDLSFSKKIFLTTFVQYNNQLDNLNINARLQWRYKPASDIFFVYTDNYLTDSFDQFTKRNRAVVLKMNYWLSI